MPLPTPIPGMRPRRRAHAVAIALIAGCAGCVLMGLQPGVPPATAPGSASPGVGSPSASRPAPAPPPLDPPTTPPPVDTQADKEGREAEILFYDGKRVSGALIEENSEKIVVSIAGIPTTFQKTEIRRIVMMPPLEERFQTIRNTIPDQDYDSLIRLADWIRGRGRLDLSLEVIDEVLKAEPQNPGAKELKTLVLAQVAVATNKGVNKGDHLPVQARPSAFPLLTKDQINLIRVFEVDLANPPRMLIGRDTVSRFLQKYAGTTVEGKGQVPTTPEGREIFYHMRPSEVLAWMFDLKARDFYPEVTVLDNPKAFQNFRDNLNRNWVTNACATARCHGGEEAGRLWLYNQQPSSDSAAYTNFLILDRFRLANGLPLINYNEPTRSPLLQMGLPRDLAAMKHPEVAGPGKGKWQPVFRSQEDARFTQAVDWMKSLYPKRPEYPVDYKVPVPNPKAPHSTGPDGLPSQR